MSRKPLRRRYVVALTPQDAERLHAFENATDAELPWPHGPNPDFRRTNESTFVVRDWTSGGMAAAIPTTVGRATFIDRQSMKVTIRNRGLWVGYLLIAVGLMCVCLTPRDGVGALVLGLALILAGRFFWLSRFVRTGGLDQTEETLRDQLRGTWT